MNASGLALSLSAIERTPGWRLFRGIRADAARRGLPLVTLRPRDQDPATALSGGDYDYLMPPGGFPQLVEGLWQRAADEGASFSINRNNPHKIQVHVHVPEVGRSIQLEVWTRLDVRDPARRSARFMLWRDLAPMVRAAADGVSRLRPDVEIACYLSHLATRGKEVETPLVAQRLAAYTAMAVALAPTLAPLCRDLTTAGIPAAAAAANAYLREVQVLGAQTRFGALCDSVRSEFGAVGRKWRRHRHRQGRIIAVTGADGVGKSTVIARWSTLLRGGLRAQRFKNLFRHHPAYQAFYRLRARATRRDLGGTMPRNAFDEIHSRTMFHIARATWMWFHLLVLLRGRRCLDRGFPDLLFQGLRGTATATLCPDWASLASLMPQPDWHIHLDAPDAVIRERKQELSITALGCYRAGMARIVGTAPAPAFSRIDTGRTVEEVQTCLHLAADAMGFRLPWSSHA